MVAPIYKPAPAEGDTIKFFATKSDGGAWEEKNGVVLRAMKNALLVAVGNQKVRIEKGLVIEVVERKSNAG